MSVKTLLVATFLSIPLVAMPANWPVMEGEFPDGTKVMYQCQGKFEGKVAFVFQTPEGKGYRGVIVCGKDV